MLIFDGTPRHETWTWLRPHVQNDGPRGLDADALDTPAPEAGVDGSLADRMRGAAAEWETPALTNAVSAEGDAERRVAHASRSARAQP